MTLSDSEYAEKKFNYEKIFIRKSFDNVRKYELKRGELTFVDNFQIRQRLTVSVNNKLS